MFISRFGFILHIKTIKMTITITKENFAEVMLQIAEMLKEREILEFEEINSNIELVYTDLEQAPEKVKENYNKLFDEKWKVKDFSQFKSVEDVF